MSGRFEDLRDLIDLLKTLIRIPSVNDGKNLNPEKEISEYISNYLRNIGMEVKIILSLDNRPNVYGYWEHPIPQKPTLVLSTHMDTVNVDDMKIDPFDPKEVDGRIYGRGSSDTKASLALYLWTLKQIADIHQRLSVNVQFLGTCNEENGCVGSRFLVDAKKVSADYMIVGEPTECRVAIAHKGRATIKLETTGKSAHSSTPHLGENAIYKMNHIIEMFQKWTEDIGKQKDALLGPALSSITKIIGGTRINVIPEKCYAYADLRYLPSQDPKGLVNQLQGKLGGKCSVSVVEVQPALYTNPDTPIIADLIHIVYKIVNKEGVVGLPFLTDAAEFARTGAKCVVFGPGSISEAHKDIEFVEIDQLKLAANIMNDFFKTLL